MYNLHAVNLGKRDSQVWSSDFDPGNELTGNVPVCTQSGNERKRRHPDRGMSDAVDTSRRSDDEDGNKYGPERSAAGSLNGGPSMDESVLSILRCPVTGSELTRLSDDRIGTPDGRHVYRYSDGIYHLLPSGQPDAPQLRKEKRVVQTFYDTFGWQKTEGGSYQDTAIFVDTRSVSRNLTSRCMRRVKKYLPKRGRFLLDAGSGPIPHDEYLEYHENFERRICIDLSELALREAQKKLGDRGVYIIGDMTNLPLKDGVIDGIVSSHVIYHIPADEQPKAFKELWRVLAPGGRAAIVYVWPRSPVATALQWLFCRLLPVNASAATAAGEARPDLYFHAHSWEWFKRQNWPFRYRIASFRLISNDMMRRHFNDGFISRAIASGILAFQAAFPGLAGKYGKYPIILIEKT
jgi:ubiquinone/menaquinone biosynthesis C-methylase UbiE/uncharacterized protein YbaR (Trm112 family)